MKTRMPAVPVPMESCCKEHGKRKRIRPPGWKSPHRSIVKILCAVGAATELAITLLFALLPQKKLTEVRNQRKRSQARFCLGGIANNLDMLTIQVTGRNGTIAPQRIDQTPHFAAFEVKALLQHFAAHRSTFAPVRLTQILTESVLDLPVKGRFCVSHV